MDALESLTVRIRRIRALLAGNSTGDGDTASDQEADDVSRAYRLLRLVKLLLVIILTALTIGRMLGWL